MTKEEFVQRVMKDKYKKLLKAKKEYLCNEADIHNICSTRKSMDKRIRG